MIPGNRHHRLTHEHHLRHVGHERQGPRTRNRQSVLVLGHHGRPGRVRRQLFLLVQESVQNRIAPFCKGTHREFILGWLITPKTRIVLGTDTG